MTDNTNKRASKLCTFTTAPKATGWRNPNRAFTKSEANPNNPAHRESQVWKQLEVQEEKETNRGANGAL